MKSVVFSILVPVYNQKLRLDNSLNCILNQTYSDFEVIIVDDKSTDNSLKILTEFSKKDNRIKLYKNLVKELAREWYLTFFMIPSASAPS